MLSTRLGIGLDCIRQIIANAGSFLWGSGNNGILWGSGNNSAKWGGN